MGGLSNIIDGIYNDDGEEKETGATSSEVPPEQNSTASGPSLQQLADEMSRVNETEKETPDDGISEEARFITQEDVFETPAYENTSELPEAPTPPEAVSFQMIERLKAVGIEPDEDSSESNSEFTIAPPPEGLVSEDFETMDDDESNSEDDYDLDSTRNLKATLGAIASDSTYETQEESVLEEDPLEEIRTHSSGSFIWTRDADDILPGRKNR